MVRRGVASRTFLLTFLAAAQARATVEVDLALGADWTAWGAGADDHAGYSTATGDINGDGATDVVMLIRNWAGGDVCAWFGPIAIPGSWDLLADTPPMCILTDFDYEASWDGLTVADIDGDGLDDVLAGSRMAPIPGEETRSFP